MKISFVILHYLTTEDTIECLESILELEKENVVVNIIIVDNNSPNDSGFFLQDKYADFENIHIIINKKNLGFAKGNNIGFKYAKEVLGSDFIIMINNDTYITDTEFLNKIVKEYSKMSFDIAGPKIVSTVDYSNQNPVRQTLFKISDIKRRRRKLWILYWLNKVNLDFFFLKLKNFFEKEELRDVTSYSIQLHGSCLIFSPSYILKYNGIYNETFMYFEEDILKYISIRDKLKMVYVPNITIYHKEDSATNELHKSNREKRQYFYLNGIDSLTKFINLMEIDRDDKYNSSNI